VSSVRDLNRRLDDFKVGDRIRLGLQRRGQPLTVEIGLQPE